VGLTLDFGPQAQVPGCDVSGILLVGLCARQTASLWPCRGSPFLL